MEFLVTAPLLIIDDLGTRKLHLTPPKNCWRSSCAAMNGWSLLKRSLRGECTDYELDVQADSFSLLVSSFSAGREC